jgi:glycine cleavage system T protein (aminomethyltransferase)
MLLRTPLFEAHARLGARMVDFAGWAMPVQYPSGIIAEHLAVRSGCGIFDLSHMGRVYVRGADALALAQLCCTRDLSRIRPGEAAYTVLCQPDGGIVDDVIASVLGPSEVLFVFNAANRDKDVAWFTAHRDQHGWSAALDDQTLGSALIGVQGPRAETVLQGLCNTPLGALPGYAFVTAGVADRPAFVSRTGYTGEDGFEVMVHAEHAEHVWNSLLAQDGVHTAGLGARDTLRTEAGMALYGHEIDEHTNPYEARLGWVVSLKKPDFVGRAALAEIKARGPERSLVGLEVAPGGVPRPGFPIVHQEEPVGLLTSGTHSPSLRRSIGLGYVPLALSSPGQALAVEMRGKSIPASVVALPFVPHHSRPRAKM